MFINIINELFRSIHQLKLTKLDDTTIGEHCDAALTYESESLVNYFDIYPDFDNMVFDLVKNYITTLLTEIEDITLIHLADYLGFTGYIPTNPRYFLLHLQKEELNEDLVLLGI